MAVKTPRDPVALFEQVRQQWGDRGDRWVFGYASLIWRPEFDAAEHRPALVRGWHRAFQMRSRVNRGTPEQPGLVYALVSGGTCRGMVYRIAREQAPDELPRLWRREMPHGGVYDPRWLRCHTAAGEVPALAFTLSRRSPHFTGRLADNEMLHILRHACGRYGSTLDYLERTAAALRQHHIRDTESERLLALARDQGLMTAQSAAGSDMRAPTSAARAAARSASVSTSSSTPGSSSSRPSDG